MASNKAVQSKRKGTKARGLARTGCSFISGHVSNPCPRQWLVKHPKRWPVGTSAGTAESTLMNLGPSPHLRPICIGKKILDASSCCKKRKDWQYTALYMPVLIFLACIYIFNYSWDGDMRRSCKHLIFYKGHNSMISPSGKKYSPIIVSLTIKLACFKCENANMWDFQACTSFHIIL